MSALSGSWGRAAGAIFLDWLAPPTDAHWLDIGCGTGLFTELILDTRSPATVFAIDQAEAQIEHARRKPAAQRANSNVGDAQALPFPDSTFDVVVSALVINFIPDRPRALSEMRRVARSRWRRRRVCLGFRRGAFPKRPVSLGHARGRR